MGKTSLNLAILMAAVGFITQAIPTAGYMVSGNLDAARPYHLPLLAFATCFIFFTSRVEAQEEEEKRRAISTEEVEIVVLFEIGSQGKTVARVRRDRLSIAEIAVLLQIVSTESEPLRRLGSKEFRESYEQALDGSSNVVVILVDQKDWSSFR